MQTFAVAGTKKIILKIWDSSRVYNLKELHSEDVMNQPDSDNTSKDTSLEQEGNKR